MFVQPLLVFLVDTAGGILLSCVCYVLPHQLNSYYTLVRVQWWLRSMYITFFMCVMTISCYRSEGYIPSNYVKKMGLDSEEWVPVITHPLLHPCFAVGGCFSVYIQEVCTCVSVCLTLPPGLCDNLPYRQSLILLCLWLFSLTGGFSLNFLGQELRIYSKERLVTISTISMVHKIFKAELKVYVIVLVVSRDGEMDCSCVYRVEKEGS